MEQSFATDISNFGRHLKFWRDRKKMSQLELAGLASTTPRHISFVETGRSRPGRELVLRIARAMELPIREINELMSRAGFAPEYAEHGLNAKEIEPFREAIEAILNKHDPYPAMAMDSIGNILMANKSFVAFSPGATSRTPEETVEMVFDPNSPVRGLFENWEEVVWNLYDRQQAELATNSSPRLEKLVRRKAELLKNVKRPKKVKGDNPLIFSPRVRFGDQVVSTFATMMRFESAAEVSLSEVRVELIFPVDNQSREFFELLSKNSDVLPYSGIG